MFPTISANRYTCTCYISKDRRSITNTISPKAYITLRRTPHLPPKYAAFDVPLSFSKLDIKTYLKSVYNVDVIHVRSAVFQAQMKRERAVSPYAQGKRYRPRSKKKMTVELVDPFVWPEQVTDFSAYVHPTV